jgi:hypothetical protein
MMCSSALKGTEGPCLVLRIVGDRPAELKEACLLFAGDRVE